MLNHTVGTREEWLAASKDLLAAREGAFAPRRRARPPAPGPSLGPDREGVRLRDDRRDGRSQLLVYHFMFGFGYRVDEQNPGCTGCSFVADHFDGVLPHLNGHDVTLVAESIAPLPELLAYAARMEWKFPWVSSLGGGFRSDFGAAFTEEEQQNGAVYNFRHEDEVAPQREGMSAFILQDGVVHHTYSTYARGVEQLMGTFSYLDVSPLGRNEDPDDPGAWWHRHDEYDALEANGR